MRLHDILVLVLLPTLTACPGTEHVAGVCCVTDAQCATIGLGPDDHRPCEVGQACKANLCVAAECTGSADCTDPNLPVCSLGLCVAGCQINDDCAGVAGKPICGHDSMCVGCETSAQCPADHAICDATDRQCRGCERDDECAGGVCLEADNVCVADADVIFVKDLGVDAGTCTRTSPCATLNFAMTKIGGSRQTVHILSGSLAIQQAVDIPPGIVIDGTNTSLSGGANPLVQVAAQRSLTLEGVTLAAGTAKALSVNTGATARLFSVTSRGGVGVTGGTIDARSSVFDQSTVTCSAGTVTIRESSMNDSEVDPTNCALSIRQTRYDGRGFAVFAMGGQTTLENNLFVARDGLQDCVALLNAAPGSVVQFNTFVNTNSVPSDGAALSCDAAAVVVRDNIFAYNSMHPLGTGTCRATSTLFDNVAIAAQTAGTSNKVAPASTFFVDPLTGDFHLSTTSPAREAGADSVGEDLEGHRRPQPAGTNPDVGAFEAP